MGMKKKVKMKKQITILVTVMLLMGFTGNAHALLLSRLGGAAVYDTDFDITWLSDAYLADSETFGVPGTLGGMHWDTANTWITRLNTSNHLGFSDWRLPTADPACGLAFNCTSSEMGHLFYDELGGTVGSSILDSSDPDLSLFTNIRSAYWATGAEYLPSGPTFKWVFGLPPGRPDHPARAHLFRCLGRSLRRCRSRA